MNLLIFKIIFAVSIFSLALLAGFVPLKIAKHNVKLLNLCDAFASGIFLSTAIIHLLPDAVTKYNTVYSESYPFVYLTCIATFILLLVLERGMSIYTDKRPHNKIIMPIFLVSLLSIHSIIEGAAIGANINILETITIFFAVFAHKGSESFVLTLNLNRFGVNLQNIKKTLIWFALMTPIGILLASSMMASSAINSNPIMSAFFHAITAGTFLYLGIEYLASCKKSFSTIAEIITLLLGVILMALVAIWT